MSNTDLHKTLIAIGRSPLTFRRDTPLLLKTLDNLAENNRRAEDLETGAMSRGFMFKKQAD